MKGLIEFLVASFATWQVVELAHHSEIGWPLRKFARECQKREDYYGFFGRLYTCPFCLSHWVAAAVLILVLSFGYWLVWLLAIVRAANLLNDVFHTSCRTPHFDPDELETMEEQ